MASQIDFCTLAPEKRLDYLRRFAELSEEEVKLLSTSEGFGLKMADRMIENVVGFMPIPLGIASGLNVNDKEYLVPMATEQKSVISMVIKGAELARTGGGFKAKASSSTMIGQIQLIRVPDFKKARENISANEENILQEANTQSRTRKAIGVEVKSINTSKGPMLVVELLVDVKDSMGANVVNSMCETVSPMISSLSGGTANVRVVSNLATKRLVHIETVVSTDAFENSEIIERIVDASAFAENDPFRAATHNKGVMNAVSATLLATSNDTRAVEAGAHAYAALSGQYRPLSVWHKNEGGELWGKLTMPMAIGAIGGAIATHPTAKIALKIMRVKTAKELGEVVGSAGLAYNLAALHMLVSADLVHS